MMRKWKTAIYVRLSSDDKDTLESNSIINQKELIKYFVSKHKDMSIVDFYEDDGYSGTTFNRPGFQRMLSDIKNKLVDTVIVKDLSRLGRNYTEVGAFIDEILPQYSLRFISVNDNVDSYLNPESMQSIEIPFKNVINENYAKDISNKIRSSYYIRKTNGDYIGVVAPYGYYKDPDDCHKFLVDDEAAEIIKKIFNMALNGISRQNISNELNELHILTPSKYIQHKYNYSTARVSEVWDVHAVDRIIKNETYIGTLVQGKKERVSHKIHTVILKPEEDWIKVEKHHTPIIDKKIFKQVNSILYDRNSKVNNKNKYPTYTGYLKCADCGHTLTRNKRGKNGAAYYYCISYLRKKTCSKHYITEKELNEIMIELFNKYINLVCDIDDRINKLLIDSKLHFDKEIKKIKNVELKKDIKKYEKLLDELIKDYENDYISKEEFDNYNNEYLYELNNLRIKYEEVNKEGDENIEWIRKLKELKRIDSIDRKLISGFIENIYINSDSSIKVVFKNEDEFKQTLKLLKKNKSML